MASVTPRTWNKLLIGAAFILIAFGTILIVAYAIYAYRLSVGQVRSAGDAPIVQ